MTGIALLSLVSHELEWGVYKHTHTKNAEHLVAHGIGDPKFNRGPDQPYHFRWASVTTTASSDMPVTISSTGWLDTAKTARSPDQDFASLTFKILWSKAQDKA